jgi:preprotein translocase subunit YajC
MLSLFLLLAEENGKAPAASPPAGFDFLPFLLVGGLLYFLLLRPTFRQEKERKALRANLKKDDKIITTSGLYGVVVSVSDKEDEVVVRMAPDNIRLKMVKAAIDRNLTNEEAAREAKAAGVKPEASTGVKPAT